MGAFMITRLLCRRRGHLGLRQTHFNSGLEDCIEHGHFLPLKALHLGSNGSVIEASI